VCYTHLLSARSQSSSPQLSSGRFRARNPAPHGEQAGNTSFEEISMTSTPAAEIVDAGSIGLSQSKPVLGKRSGRHAFRVQLE
jgi:hypothetical protein